MWLQHFFELDEKQLKAQALTLMSEMDPGPDAPWETLPSHVKGKRLWVLLMAAQKHQRYVPSQFARDVIARLPGDEFQWPIAGLLVEITRPVSRLWYVAVLEMVQNTDESERSEVAYWLLDHALRRIRSTDADDNHLV